MLSVFKSIKVTCEYAITKKDMNIILLPVITIIIEFYITEIPEQSIVKIVITRFNDVIAESV